ncbi:MAG: hypothetical protein K8R19_04520 [Methanosarcinales archaeon]|nr:hypothetical protein [Methanosarcinales archaeon]
MPATPRTPIPGRLSSATGPAASGSGRAERPGKYKLAGRRRETIKMNGG